MFVHMNIKPMDGVDMSEEHQDLFLVLDAAKDGERGGAADSVDKGERRLESVEERVACFAYTHVTRPTCSARSATIATSAPREHPKGWD